MLIPNTWEEGKLTPAVLYVFSRKHMTLHLIKQILNCLNNYNGYWTTLDCTEIIWQVYLKIFQPFNFRGFYCQNSNGRSKIINCSIKTNLLFYIFDTCICTIKNSKRKPGFKSFSGGNIDKVTNNTNDNWKICGKEKYSIQSSWRIFTGYN